MKPTFKFRGIYMKKVWFFTCSLVILLCQAGIAQIDGNDLS